MLAALAGVQAEHSAVQRHIALTVLGSGDFKAVRLEEAADRLRAGEADLAGGVLLGFKKKQPGDQIAQTLMAALGIHPNEAQMIGAFLPPDAADGCGRPVVKDHGVPAFRIQFIGSRLKDRLPQRQYEVQRVARTDPFTLNHENHPFNEEAIGVTKEQIARINELAKKKRTVGLTEQEVKEQQALRRQYIDEFKENLQLTLDNTFVQRPDGSKEKLQKKRPN